MPDDHVDYYELLEVDPSASTEQIQKAWQNKHRMWNQRKNAPDRKRRHEAELQTELIDEARAVLCDNKKRQDYDQKRAKPASRMEAPHAPQVNPYAPQMNPYAPQMNPYAPQMNPYAPQMNPYAPQMNPISPPMPPSQVRYDQSPAAEAKQKRNKRMLRLGAMGGGGVGGAVAIGIPAERGDIVGLLGGLQTVIIAAILGAVVGAILGAIVGAISLAVIRKRAGREALAFVGGKEAGIVTIAGIVAGAIVIVFLYLAPNLAFLFVVLAVLAVTVVAGVVAGALVAGSVRKKRDPIAPPNQGRNFQPPTQYVKRKKSGCGKTVLVLAVCLIVYFIVSSIASGGLHSLNFIVATGPRPKGATDTLILKSVAAQIQKCAQSAVAQPANCPQGSNNPPSSASSIVWTLFGDPTRDAKVTFEGGSNFRVNGRFVMTLDWISNGFYGEVDTSPYIAEVAWSLDKAVVTSLTADMSGSPEAPLLPRLAGETDRAALAATRTGFKGCAADPVGDPIACPFGESFSSSSTNIQWTLQSDVTLNARVTYDNTTGLVHVIGSFAVMVTYNASGNKNTDHQSGNYEALLAWQTNHLIAIAINKAS